MKLARKITGIFAMSRRMAALFRSAAAVSLVVLLSAAVCINANSAPADSVDSATVTQKPVAKKAPARQVPAETIEKLLEEEPPTSDDDEDDSTDLDVRTESADTSDGDAVKTEEPASKDTGLSNENNVPDVAEDKVSAPEPDEAPEMKPSEQDDADQPAKKTEDKPADQASSVSSDTAEVKSGAGRAAVDPGLPRRKPRKPIIRKNDRRKADGNKKLRRGSDKQKYLCRALQACRNEFIRCKGKIKHPDQSPEWSVAKEACGAVYKTCVEKDFQSGEWFFTRWFYFQELNCK